MRIKRLIQVLLLLVWITPYAFGAGRKEVCTPESLYDLTIRRDVTPEKFVYNWRDAVLMKALIDMSRRDEARRPEIEAYVADVMTRLAPGAHGRHPNGVAAGIGFSFLQEIGRNTPETDEALRRVLVQYKEIPRAENGACSHRGNRVELWDDSLYMLEIFLLQPIFGMLRQDSGIMAGLRPGMSWRTGAARGGGMQIPFSAMMNSGEGEMAGWP